MDRENTRLFYYIMLEALLLTAGPTSRFTARVAMHYLSLFPSIDNIHEPPLTYRKDPRYESL
jgi:hypothetical protein